MNSVKTSAQFPTPEKSYVRWGLWLFLISALLGASMRLFWVVELPFYEYTHVLHAHSHLAMLGWGFTVICTLFIFFLSPHLRHPKAYRRLLLTNVLVSLLMTAAFVVNGYTILSISLLTAHLLIAYRIAYLLFYDLNKLPNKTAYVFGKWAIFWMIISTIGVWFLPVVIVNFGKLDPLYFASIEFFLHLQFNGWFVYSVLVFLFLTLERKGILLIVRNAEFWLLQLSLVLTYGLPAYWSYPIPILNYLNGIGVVIQLLVFGKIFLPVVKKWMNLKHEKADLSDVLINVGLLSLLIKTGIQFTLILPSFLAASAEIRQFFIGFIHLIMLGVFTLTCLGVCLRFGLIPANKVSKAGLWMLMFGFVSTELVLFLQGILLWNSLGLLPFYPLVILGFTIFLPVGLAFVIASYYSNSKNTTAISLH
ncbi:hypothetical protein [Algoriphagus sp.]|uniref:hypothetical protein n=1 Tax=Algoriphagus sp. TaxID=1872435 RepID=UPI00326EC443